MNKKELMTIEEKLSDTVISDGVLDKARTEMQKTEPKPKKAVGFNYKILLSCAASFIVCLAIILPVSISVFDKSNSDKFGSNSDQSGHPQAPGDNISGLPSIFVLEELNKNIVFDADQDNETGGDEPQLPSDPVAPDIKIVYKAHYIYSFTNVEIISEEKYSVNGCQCVVYTLYNTEHTVDVLDEFSDLDFEYSTEKLTFNYDKTPDGYLADAVYGRQRYSFRLNNAEYTVLEGFCHYLTEKILN